MGTKNKRVVIIGGSFAGLTAAINLPKSYQVTLIDPSPYLEWTPNIHEIVSNVKTGSGVQLPRKAILEKHGHTFLQEAVTSIDSDRKLVVAQNGTQLPYDVCLVATGGQSISQNVAGAQQHAIPFRQAGDCQQISALLQQMLSQFSSVSVTIIGAGLSGVEALGEVLRRYKECFNLSIQVVESQSRLVPDMPKILDHDIRAKCQPYPVEFYPNAQVDNVSSSQVHLADGRVIDSDLTIWTAGISPPAFLEQADLISDSDFWAPVHQSLQSVYNDAVFVAGDVAGLPTPLAKQAHLAIDMGTHAAENIKRHLSGRSLKDYRPALKPMIMSFGNIESYLISGSTVLASKWFAAGKEAVYQLYMAKYSWSFGLFDWNLGIANRFIDSVMKMVLPEISSLSSIMSLRHVRILQLPYGCNRQELTKQQPSPEVVDSDQ